MILFKNIRLPKISGITLWPFVLVRAVNPSKELINHERIHLRQQIELLILPFYFIYFLEWLFHYIKIQDFWEAYYHISFEKEAYANECDLEYLKNRPIWVFRKYYGKIDFR